MITEKYISIVGAILLILLACYKIFKLRTVTNKEITDFKKEIGDSYYLIKIRNIIGIIFVILLSIYLFISGIKI